MTSASSMQSTEIEAGHPKPVLWDNPEGSGGEGGGRGVQDGGIHVYGDGKNHPNVVIILHLKQVSEVKSLSRVRLFATPWTVAYQAPLSMRFSRQEYWSGLPFPSPGPIKTN